MTFVGDFQDPDPLRAAIRAATLADEEACVEALIREADPGLGARRRIAAMATTMVERIREQARDDGGLDAFMHEYDLSSQEGVMLMCLAEALLRVPDADTADKLIADKIGGAHWDRHMGQSESLFVNASTWALMLTGRLVRIEGEALRDPRSLLKRLVARSGEPVIRQAMVQAMRIMGRQFVMGRTIEEALARARDDKGYVHSYDMLGEAAHTAKDAERYFEAYTRAIGAVGRRGRGARTGGQPGYFHQAVGAAPALRDGATRPGSRRTDAAG